MVVGPDWKGAAPPGIRSGRCSGRAHSCRWPISHPAFQPRRPRQREEGSGRLQGADAFRLPEPAAARARRPSTFPKIDNELVKTNFFEYLDLALQFAPAEPNETEIRAQLARIGIGPGGRTVDSAVGCQRFRSNLCREQGQLILLAASLPRNSSAEVKTSDAKLYTPTIVSTPAFRHCHPRRRQDFAWSTLLSAQCRARKTKQVRSYST
jgi:hypothetical protein